MSKFKVGDKVRCIEPDVGEAYLKYGKEYTIKEIIGKCVYLEDVGYEWYTSRFELVEPETKTPVAEEQKPHLTLKFGSISITLDPNVHLSRKFAEVFLNVVYEENK